MADTIHIKLPDGSVKDVPKGTTALDVAKSISPRLADAALVAQISSNDENAGSDNQQGAGGSAGGYKWGSNASSER
jgi:threonyl-tRNA synthetase